MGTYSKKFMATQDQQAVAEMKLITYAAVHNLPFDHFSHLIKTIREAFPDSPLAQRMKMGYTSATYHLNFGLSRTEKRKLDQELNSVPFSASLDAGSKGNKKRMEIFVKYWSEKRHKVVEMFFGAVTLNVENAISLTESFLGALRSRNINRVSI